MPNSRVRDAEMPINGTHRLQFRLDGFIAKEITVPSKKLHIQQCEKSVIICLFLSVFAHKKPSPFSIHTTKKF